MLENSPRKVKCVIKPIAVRRYSDDVTATAQYYQITMTLSNLWRHFPQTNAQICFDELAKIPELKPVMPSGSMYMMVSEVVNSPTLVLWVPQAVEQEILWKTSYHQYQ